MSIVEDKVMSKDRGFENNNVVPIANGLRSHMGWAGHKEKVNPMFGYTKSR